MGEFDTDKRHLKNAELALGSLYWSATRALQIRRMGA